MYYNVEELYYQHEKEKMLENIHSTIEMAIDMPKDCKRNDMTVEMAIDMPEDMQ